MDRARAGREWGEWSLCATVIAVVVIGIAIGGVWAWNDTRAEQVRNDAANAVLEATTMAWIAQAREATRRTGGALALERVLRDAEIARNEGTWKAIENEAKAAQIHLAFARTAGERASAPDRQGLARSLDRLEGAARAAYAPKGTHYGGAAIIAALGAFVGAVVAAMAIALAALAVMAADDWRRKLRKMRTRRA